MTDVTQWHALHGEPPYSTEKGIRPGREFCDLAAATTHLSFFKALRHADLFRACHRGNPLTFGLIAVEHSYDYCTQNGIKKGGLTGVQYHNRRKMNDVDDARVLRDLQGGRYGREELGLNPNLSPKGIMLAQTLRPVMDRLREGQYLGPCDQPTSSHLYRCIQTAEEAGFENELDIAPALGERIMGEDHGMTDDQMQRLMPDRYKALQSGAPLYGPHTEPIGMYWHRTEAIIIKMLLEIMRDQYCYLPGRYHMVFTHQSFIKLLVAALLQKTKNMWSLKVDKASLWMFLLWLRPCTQEETIRRHARRCMLETLKKTGEPSWMDQDFYWDRLPDHNLTFSGIPLVLNETGHQENETS